MPPSDDPIIIEPRVKPQGSDDPIIIEPAGSDDPIILEPDSVKNDGAPITVQPVKVSWWKRWSTHLSAINLTAIIASIVLIPERILNAIPNPVWALIGIAFLAVILIPGATSIKQVKKVD